ncbi:uncharacterized protein LOC108676253 [Hyalella azteca]|uniref:Uncharacterized protein LOC108676253 n=1 Tax=Hyalella azteca TaxID=294128 RepID=A0A8B7P1F3_HYAAZ|nr:uncharacterized protein LOC108676253 [Hyalella azteca]
MLLRVHVIAWLAMGRLVCWSEAVKVDTLFQRIYETCKNPGPQEKVASLTHCSAKCNAAKQECLGFCYSRSTKLCVLHKPYSLYSSNHIDVVMTYIYHSGGLPHAIAYSNCRAWGGYLAVPANWNEAYNIRSVSNWAENLWLGLDAIDRNGQVVTSGPYSDYGGQSVRYLDWKSEQPDNLQRHEQCLEIWAGYFNDASCDLARPYVCQSCAPYSRVSLPDSSYPSDYKCYRKIR